jgi:hypothetical protein
VSQKHLGIGVRILKSISRYSRIRIGVAGLIPMVDAIVIRELKFVYRDRTKPSDAIHSAQHVRDDISFPGGNFSDRFDSVNAAKRSVSPGPGQ